MFRFMIFVSFIAICVLNNCIFAEEVDVTSSTKQYNTTISNIITSTVAPTPNITCEAYNNDCKKCIENSKCYYCSTTDKCHYHFAQQILDGDCKISDAYFLTCNVNFRTMMIIIGVLCGIAVILILVVCCYCCCKRKSTKMSKDDLKWARQREERKQIAAERKRERAERTEEIRKKYGLIKDSNPYQKFDA